MDQTEVAENDFWGPNLLNVVVNFVPEITFRPKTVEYVVKSHETTLGG